MRIIVLILTFIFVSDFAFSQIDTTAYRIVDEMPIFKDSTGIEAFHDYINLNIDLTNIQDNLISGRIIIQFCVDTLGHTSDIKIINSLRDDFDNAVVNVIKESPKWNPGKKNGKSVKVLYTLPMNFDFQ